MMKIYSIHFYSKYDLVGFVCLRRVVLCLEGDGVIVFDLVILRVIRLNGVVSSVILLLFFPLALLGDLLGKGFIFCFKKFIILLPETRRPSNSYTWFTLGFFDFQ